MLATAATFRAPCSTLRAFVQRSDLDDLIDPALTAELDRLRSASEHAWSAGADAQDGSVAEARLYTQRALYELNRLSFYWFDDPSHYVNEHSAVLRTLHEQLEPPWQAWLARAVPREDLEAEEPQAVLERWVERDLTESWSEAGEWFAREADLAGYRQLLQILSVNGLVEASQLSRVMGGAPHPVQSTLFRILMEEYGAGRPHKKHSHFFAAMLEEQGLSAEPEAYLSCAPWEVLSAINHSFHLTESRRTYLRFCGAFTYTELSTPVGFRGYAAAAKRLGLSDGHNDYWALHVREDERHGAWMVHEVARPLLTQFPAHARDVLFGYAQQRLVESMAGQAVYRACRSASEGRAAQSAA